MKERCETDRVLDTVSVLGFERVLGFGLGNHFGLKVQKEGYI